MKLILLPALTLFALAFAWQCPECGAENQDSYCNVCHLPEPPDGMVYIPATTVEIDGESVDVSRFFIDVSPVTYREFLPWLNNSGFSSDELGIIITGDGENPMDFLAFTPFQGDQQGGVTVPSVCLENPVASITWNGAQSFLSEQGKRLPSLAEMYAADAAGVIQPFDTYTAMLAFANQMRAGMGELLGTVGTQAMFAGYSTERERIMWEFTGTVPGDDAGNTAPSSDAKYIHIIKPADGLQISATDRDDGYFNVIFRGAIQVP